MARVSQYLKAIYGAVTAAVTTTAGEYVQGKGHIGYEGGILIFAAFWGALGVIWGVPNAPPLPKIGKKKPEVVSATDSSE